MTQHAGYGVFDRDSLLPKRPKLRSNDAMSYSLPRLLAPISILFALLGCTVSPGRVEADVKCGKGKGKFVAVKGTKVKCKAGAEELVVKFTNNDAKFELVEGKRQPPPPT